MNIDFFANIIHWNRFFFWLRRKFELHSVFFLQTNFDFLTSDVWQNFLLSFKKILLFWAQILKINPPLILIKVMGL